jgi:hypothetical protein
VAEWEDRFAFNRSQAAQIPIYRKMIDPNAELFKKFVKCLYTFKQERTKLWVDPATARGRQLASRHRRK